MDPVFSRHDTRMIACGPRRYTIAPLTFLERTRFSGELTRLAGPLPTTWQVNDALAAAVREASPGNADELLGVIEQARALTVEDGENPPPEVQALRAKVFAITQAAAAVPVYAAVLAAQQRYFGMLPYVAAQHALRGWEGEGLPPFVRVGGVVADELLAAVPAEDVERVGWEAHQLMRPGQVAEGNSASPSPSRASPGPATAVRSRRTGAAGS